MGTIVVIGGGELKEKETFSIDKEIVLLTKKKRPRALFIPTASGEPKEYIETFNRIYGQELGCSTDVLYCLDGDISKKTIQNQILTSDLIYVGGGNTLKMMSRWRFLGIDSMLHAAYRKGIVLSGLSAGGVCWFDYGHSDSMKLYGHDPWKYIRVKGLGIVKGIHCPHFDSALTKRKDQFINFMKKYSDIGIALDNCASLVIEGRNGRILSSKKTAYGYKVWKNGKMVHIRKLPSSFSLFHLYDRHI